jgi:biotin transport system substrate-specific component
MSNLTVQTVPQSRSLSATRQVLLVVGASLLMAILARFSTPLPFTPVLLSLSNLGVLFIALTLGSRRAAAALLLYLAEGAIGLPVFSNGGLGGIAQILGPTGGFLMAYPVVAFLVGWITERSEKSALRFTIAAFAGELLLFSCGVSWLMAIFRIPLAQAVNWGVYPFAFFEIMKIMVAVGASLRLHRFSKLANFIA